MYFLKYYMDVSKNVNRKRSMGNELEFCSIYK